MHFFTSFLHFNLNVEGIEGGIQCYILESIVSGKAKQGCLYFQGKKLSACVGINWCLSVRL